MHPVKERILRYEAKYGFNLEARRAFNQAIRGGGKNPWKWFMGLFESKSKTKNQQRHHVSGNKQPTIPPRSTLPQNGTLPTTVQPQSTVRQNGTLPTTVQPHSTPRHTQPKMSNISSKDTPKLGWQRTLLHWSNPSKTENKQDSTRVKLNKLPRWQQTLLASRNKTENKQDSTRVKLNKLPRWQQTLLASRNKTENKQDSTRVKLNKLPRWQQTLLASRNKTKKPSTQSKKRRHNFLPQPTPPNVQQQTRKTVESTRALPNVIDLTKPIHVPSPRKKRSKKTPSSPTTSHQTHHVSVSKSGTSSSSRSFSTSRTSTPKTASFTKPMSHDDKAFLNFIQNYPQVTQIPVWYTKEGKQISGFVSKMDILRWLKTPSQSRNRHNTVELGYKDNNTLRHRQTTFEQISFRNDIAHPTHKFSDKPTPKSKHDIPEIIPSSKSYWKQAYCKAAHDYGGNDDLDNANFLIAINKGMKILKAKGQGDCLLYAILLSHKNVQRIPLLTNYTYDENGIRKLRAWLHEKAIETNQPEAVPENVKERIKTMNCWLQTDDMKFIASALRIKICICSESDLVWTRYGDFLDINRPLVYLFNRAPYMPEADRATNPIAGYHYDTLKPNPKIEFVCHF